MSEYGGDLTTLMEQWFVAEFLPEFYKKYGKDAEIAVFIANSAVRLDWTDPFGSGTPGGVVLGNVTGNRMTELIDNVVGKLRFVLRTGRPSADARHRPDLLEPGDFPFEGAGTYMGRTGGASGLMEESDWWVFKRVVEQYNKLRAELTKSAVDACANRDRNLKGNPDKFLEGLKIT